MQPKPVRGFARGLAVLEALNSGGAATALELSRATGIARGAVYRLLQTLMDAGYAERGAGDDRYHLRLRVRRLAGGFEDEQWIAEIARPALLAFTRRVLWPCDLLTPNGLGMVIRDTTHPVAPLSIDRNMAGRSIPLLGSAAGLAYLAFTPAAERTQLLDLLTQPPQDGSTPDSATIGKALAATRRRGYGLRQGGQLWPHTGAIALPIRHGPRAVGCVSVIWMARVISGPDGIQRCIEPLRDVRDAIERGMRR